MYGYYTPYEERESALPSSVSYKGTTDAVSGISYRYDNVGNIKKVSRSETGRGTIEESSYQYDRFNQLIFEQRDGKSWFYEYDTVGNLQWVKTLDYLSENYTDAYEAIVYAPERILAEDSYIYGDSEWQDLLTAFNGRSITYDAIGNPLTYYNGTDYTMTWEQGRRLSALHTGGKTVSYRYDSAGKRTGKTVGTGQTEYIYAGGKLFWYTAPSILSTNVSGNMELFLSNVIAVCGKTTPVMDN